MNPFRGAVTGIYISPEAAAPMHAVDRVEAVAGVGLEGDRYARQAGSYSNPDKAHQQLTLIESEAIAGAAAESGIDFDAAATRRNVVTAGVPLNHLVGRKFRVGGAVVEGVKLCEPCNHMQTLAGKPIRAPLVHRGGLNAIILVSGPIAQGDPVEPLPTDWSPA
jgi:MOSC domain-containing protein YiiM